MTRLILPAVTLSCLLTALGSAQDAKLPRDAAERIEKFEAEAAEIRRNADAAATAPKADAALLQKKAEIAIRTKKEKLVDELRNLQVEYTQSGKTKEAQAIREQMNRFRTPVETKAKVVNLLKNGSFEIGPAGNKDWAEMGVQSGSIPGAAWLITRGNLDHVHTHFQPQHGAYCIDLNGSSPGSIMQKVKTEKGRTYRVSFWMAANPHSGPPERRVKVVAADVAKEFSFDAKGRTPLNMGWQEHSFDFVASSATTTFEIISLTEGNAGAALDNVSVVLVKDEPAAP